MTDPDVKNLRKLVKRTQALASTNAIQQAMDNYYAVYDALWAYSEQTKLERKPSLRQRVGKLARFVERWAKK